MSFHPSTFGEGRGLAGAPAMSRRQEVEAARINGLNSRLLVPFTRGPSGPALQFEIELTSLDDLDQFRSRGLGSSEETAELLHSFSENLLSPPCVEILRVEE